MMNIGTRQLIAALSASALVLAIGCGDEREDEQRSVEAGAEVSPEFEYLDLEDGPHADHRPMNTVVIYDARSAQDYLDEQGIARFEYPDPFRQVGMMIDLPDLQTLEYRVPRGDEGWSDWEPALVYWSEGKSHNAHFVLEEPVEKVEIRGLEGLEFAQIDFSEKVTARQELILGDEPRLEPDSSAGRVSADEVRTATQAVAPSSMVTTRHEWGAINPDKICGSVVAPYRMAIHHTASPSSDGGDPHARMRGMQLYHLNTQGWCDIGYHFVVAQSGEIMQGRSRSNRPAAHVGGQNHGNVGISMIGNYTSTHPPEIQIQGVVDMVRWVHETHGVELNRSTVLGHREHSGASTACPGDVALGHLDDIVARAADGSDPEPPGEYDVDVSILVNGLSDFYTQGTSEDVPDGFAGDEFTVEIRVTNNSTEAIRDVELAYDLDTVGLVATDYRIETDHPGYNQSDWQLNSADDDPGNPDGAEMGGSGVLIMHAFSPGETKRVVVDMQAQAYNIGMGSFGGVRAWVRNLRDVYEVQESFGQEPDVNWVGGLLQAHTRVDVLSRAEWQFRAGESEDLEGWTGQGSFERLSVNTSHDLLAQKIDDDDAFIISPEWTRIDADRYDELVLRVRSHDGDHNKLFYWAGDGQDFNSERAVRFESPGDSEFHTLVVPVGDHPNWKGTVERIGIALLDGDAADGAESQWYDVDFIYFQNRPEGVTSSDTLDLADQSPVAIDFEDIGDDRSPRHPGGFSSDKERSFHGAFPGVAPDSEGKVRTKGGCSAAPSSTPPAGWLLLLAALMVGHRLRRRQALA